MKADFNPESKPFHTVKGQAAIEYMIVFGIALVLSLPFIMKAQTSVMELQAGSNNIAVQNTLNDIEVAVKTVSASGEPARRTFPIEMPRTLKSTEVRDNAVFIEVNTPRDSARYVRVFDVNVTGELPSESGRYMLKTEATSEGVEIEVVS